MENKKHISIVLFMLLLVFPLYGQYGPGGVQDTSGTSDLRLWLDASQLTGGHNTNISTWTDFSGNNNHVTQGSSTNRPKLFHNAINTLKVARFDGSDDYLLGNLNYTPQAPQTLFAVTYFNQITQGANDNDYVISFGGNSTPNEHCSIGRRRSNDVPPETNRYYSWDGANAQYGPLITGQQWYIISQIQNTSAPYHSLFFFGNNQTCSDYTGMYQAQSTNFRVGQFVNGSPVNGDIAEIILYDKVLNSAEMNIVHAYLAAKYNQVVANDKYSGDDNINNDNDFYVAGIGTENDGSNLVAKTQGLTLRQNSNFSEGDYVLAGSADDTNYVNTSDITLVSGFIQGRWQKTWWMDVTDDDGQLTVDLNFDYSESGINTLPSGLASCYSLIWRATDSGPWTIIANASSLVNDKVVFNNVALQLDGYYTLASCDLIASTLPITFLNFDAELIGNESEKKVKANWKTAAEINNDYFVLERSTDLLFWYEVGQIDGSGSSNNSNEYEYYDDDVINAVLYYRVKQVDFDQTYSYSNVVSVNANQIEITQIYPNPAGDNAEIVIYSKSDVNVQLNLINSEGKVVQSLSNFLQEGLNTFQMDLSNIAAGVYLVRLNTSDGIHYVQKQIIKK